MLLYQQIRRNKRNSALIILFFIGFVVLGGWLYSYMFGLQGAEQVSLLGTVGAVSFVSAFVGYYSSMQIALLSTGAKEVLKEGQFRELHRIVENICITAGIPKPKVCVIDDQSPNAFATGRNPENAAIAVSTGLLDMLEKSELEGVIAHEISHIKNYDIRIGTIVVVFVGIIAMLGDTAMRLMWHGQGRQRNSRGGTRENGILIFVGIAFMLLSPIIAKLIQLAMTRQREYLADASAVEITRYPDGLIGALQKITADDSRMKRAGTATAHLFFCTPFSEKKHRSFFREWFSTHPLPENRIQRLQEAFGG